MKNDHEIREFFHANRPEIGGEDAFLKKLDERLAVAEQVRGYCKSERKRSRRGIVIAATVGLLCGIGLMLMLIYLPSVLDPSTVIAEAADSLKSTARTGFSDAAANFDYVRFGLLVKWRHVILALLALGVVIPGGFLVVRKITE